MTVKEFKKWAASLPEKFDDYELMFREFREIKNSENISAKDIPIIGVVIDSENKEACFYDSKSGELLKKLGL